MVGERRRAKRRRDGWRRGRSGHPDGTGHLTFLTIVPRRDFMIMSFRLRRQCAFITSQENVYVWELTCLLGEIAIWVET